MSSLPTDQSKPPEPERSGEYSKPLDPQNPDQNSTDPSLPIEQNQNQQHEEEEECGFCLFMKGGSCKEVFINWEKCIEEGEKNNENIVDKCLEITSDLKKCMEANPDYYDPILQAEKAAEREAIKQLEKEKAASA